MLASLSIKALYTLALAEGEGVGTAYEYFAKRLVLATWLRQYKQQPRQVLIAGLPEKYGSSLDFVQLAEEWQAELTVVDDRPEGIEKFKTAVVAAQAEGWLRGVKPEYHLVTDWEAWTLPQQYDLAVGSELLQRLTVAERGGYAATLQANVDRFALFAPNSLNASHTNLSGLSGIHLDELQRLLPKAVRSGYIDMPPFPPGITRSEDQRAQATSGRAEAMAMWGLGYYARLEKFLPRGLRQKQSHIVYACV